MPMLPAQQMDRRNADNGHGEFDFQDAGVHVSEPFRLIGMIFQSHTRDESFIPADNDHQQQI